MLNDITSDLLIDTYGHVLITYCGVAWTLPSLLTRQWTNRIIKSHISHAVCLTFATGISAYVICSAIKYGYKYWNVW